MERPACGSEPGNSSNHVIEPRIDVDQSLRATFSGRGASRYQVSCLQFELKLPRFDGRVGPEGLAFPYPDDRVRSGARVSAGTGLAGTLKDTKGSSSCRSSPPTPSSQCCAPLHSAMTFALRAHQR